jgi:hypothetical protein
MSFHRINIKGGGGGTTKLRKIVLFQTGLVDTLCFRDLGKLKFVIMDLVFGSSQFLLLSQLPQNMKLALKVVKNDTKLVNSLYESKSVTRTVKVS